MKEIKSKVNLAIVLLVVFSSIQFGFAQKVKGIVLDEDKLPLEFVSVALLRPSDSLLIKYTSTGQDGKFDLSGFKEGEYMFQVYLMTYEANQTKIKVGKSSKDLGSIILMKKLNKLNEIVINAVVPIKIKQDTVAFSAKAFKVKKDDNVEDLIKKLPGIEIAADGTVSAQGESVTKILVDGKEFFNNDMSIALKNLTAGAIKSVQVIDEKSDDARTTGVKDGEQNKILNLVLKEDKKTGYFGKVGVGLGTDNRYATNADINRFSSKTQMAVFGKLNNTNNTGATVFRRDGSRGGNSGFLTTGTAGGNYNYEFKKDYNFNIDYHFGSSDREEEETSKRTQFTNDASFSTARENTSQSISKNHNINFSLRDRSKKGKYLEFRGGFKNDSRESDRNSSTVFFDESDKEDTSSKRITSSEDSRNSGNLALSYTNKLNENGRNLKIESKLSFSDNTDMNFQNSLNKFNISDPTNTTESKEISTRDEENKSLNAQVSFRYMEPIVKGHLISFYSSIRNAGNDENLDQRKTINEVVQNPLVYDLDYDKKTYLNQLSYRLSKEKLQINLSGTLETTQQTLEVDNVSNLNKKYNNILPRASVSYEFHKGKRIRLRYNKNISFASARQITPIVNDFNPLYVSVGNIGLTPEEKSDYSLLYYSHGFKKASSFFSYISYTNTDNAIISKRSIDDTYVQHSTYENFGSKSSFRGRLGFSKTISAIGVRYNFRSGANFSDYTTIIDDVYNETDSKSWDVGLSLSNENKNKLDVTLGANYNFNKTTYSLQGKDRDYFKQNYYTKFEWDLSNSITFNSQFDYSLFTDNNYDSQTVPIWNTAVEYAFLAGKRGNLKFQVFDMLNKNLGIVRTSSENYFEETFKKSLGTYGMLSFTYNLKPPSGKGSKRDMGTGSRSRRRRH